MKTTDKKDTEEQEVTWEELRQKCKKHDMISKVVWFLITAVSLVYLYFVMFQNFLGTSNVGRIIISSALVVIIFFWAYVMPYILGTERLYRECSKLFKEEVIEPVFTKAFHEVTYKGFDKSQLKEIKDSGLLKKARSAIATDSVRGTYDGIDFVRYDIELSTKDKSNAKIDSVWITCELKTNIKEELQIICDSFKIGKAVYPQPEGFLKMLPGDEDFDSKFCVYIKDEKDAKEILSSSVLKKLIKLERENPFIIGFEKDRVNVVIRRKKDSMEIPVYKRIDEKKFTAEAHKEVEVIKQIIELLKDM